MRRPRQVRRYNGLVRLPLLSAKICRDIANFIPPPVVSAAGFGRTSGLTETASLIAPKFDVVIFSRRISFDGFHSLFFPRSLRAEFYDTYKSTVISKGSFPSRLINPPSVTTTEIGLIRAGWRGKAEFRDDGGASLLELLAAK